jgi:hypothetical protein
MPKSVRSKEEVRCVTMTILLILYLTLLVVGDDLLLGDVHLRPRMTPLDSHTTPAKVESLHYFL